MTAPRNYQLEIKADIGGTIMKMFCRTETSTSCYVVSVILYFIYFYLLGVRMRRRLGGV